MDIKAELLLELKYLNDFETKAINISTTSKHSPKFLLLPRRNSSDIGMSSFLIGEENIARNVIRTFDGKVDYIFIDIELKQKINLFKIAKMNAVQSKLISIKPNDTTLESCDILIRRKFNDDLINKNIVIIGTGNLASKLALRLCERQANVYIKGRTLEKEKNILNAINLFIPKYSRKVMSFDQIPQTERVDVIVSFLSGKFKEEHLLYPFIDRSTFIIDGGINNFSNNFIKSSLNKNILITRLDTRIALPYQLLSIHNDTLNFFDNIYGTKTINNVQFVAGGVIGHEGAVIVDNIRQPSQIIGIADGNGGVKKDEELSQTDRETLREVKQTISGYN